MFKAAKKLIEKIRPVDSVAQMLFKAIAAHPRLPVVPVVAEDCIGGEGYGEWMSKISRVEAGKIYTEENGERFFIYSEDTGTLSDEFINEHPEAKTKEVKSYIEGLPWRDAIIVFVEPVDGERSV